MKQKFILFCMLLSIFSCLIGKDWSKFSPYLRPLTSYIDTDLTQKGVTVRAKLLSPLDCVSLLGKQSKRLFKRHRRRPPLYPIQFSITNKTNMLIALEQKNIELPLVDYHTVAHRLYCNSLIHALGGMVAGVLITGLLAAGSFFALSTSGILLIIIGSMKALAPIVLLGSSALIITPFFLVIGTPIVSTMKGVQAASYNQTIKKEMKDHTLHQTLIISPYETIDTLVFVEKKHFKESFLIHVTDPDNASLSLTFNIHLQTKRPYTTI